MKRLILPVAMLIGHLVYGQTGSLAQVNETLDHAITTAMDSTAIAYDSAGFEQVRTRFVWDGVGFVPNQRSEIFYLLNTTVKEEVAQWDGSGWKPYQQNYRQYNGANTQISSLLLYWNIAQYDTVNRTTTTLGTSTDTTIGESWVAAGTWEPTFMDVRVLNENNDVILYAQFNYDGTNFVPYNQQISRYGSGGTLDTSYYISGTTDTLSMGVFSYSNGRLAQTVLSQKLPGTGWEPLYQTIYLYNTAELLKTQTTAQWNGTAWISYNRIEYVYDEAANLITRDHYDWDNALNLWVKILQARYYYPQSTGLTSPVALTAKVWPNPFSNQLQIELPNAHTETEVVLMDMAGKEILRQTFLDEAASLDTGQLPTGVYVLLLTNGTQLYRQQVVKAW